MVEESPGSYLGTELGTNVLFVVLLYRQLRSLSSIYRTARQRCSIYFKVFGVCTSVRPVEAQACGLFSAPLGRCCSLCCLLSAVRCFHMHTPARSRKSSPAYPSTCCVHAALECQRILCCRAIYHKECCTAA
ncbi:unnamed protein product, partial [Pylaiella littoralis]